LLLYGLSEITTAVTHAQTTHTLTVGAMGLMILAMITRVSLGHTGRPLKVGKIMAAAFAMMFGAFIIRVFGALWIDNYATQILAASALWVIAHSCFVGMNAPVLTRPRVDGKSG
jgi:uncharacterized protein involved in response to NO